MGVKRGSETQDRAVKWVVVLFFKKGQAEGGEDLCECHGHFGVCPRVCFWWLVWTWWLFQFWSPEVSNRGTGRAELLLEPLSCSSQRLLVPGVPRHVAVSLQSLHGFILCVCLSALLF